MDYRALLKGLGQPMPGYDPQADRIARERQQEIRALNRAIGAHYTEGSTPPRSMLLAFDEVLAEERAALVAAMRDTGEYFAWRLERHWPGIALNMGHLDPQPPCFDAAWSKEDIDELFESLSRRAEAAGAAHRRRRIAHGCGSVPQTGIVTPARDESESLGALTGSPARASL